MSDITEQLRFHGRYASETEPQAAARRVKRNEEAAAEIDRLRAQVANPRETPFGKEAEKLADDYIRLSSECAALRAQVAEMREDAERGQWLIDWISRNGLLQAHHCYPAEGEQRGDWWLMYPPKVIDRTAPPIGYGKTEDAAIDRARKSGDGGQG